MKVVTEGVYFLFDNKQLVYIGESDNIYRRIGQHIYDGTKKFDSFEIFPCNDRKKLEGFLIRTLKPKYNVSLGMVYDIVDREDIFPSQTIEEAIKAYEKQFDTYTVGEVADLMGTYKECVCKIIMRHGEEIPVFKIDGRWKFKKVWVDKNIKELWRMLDD